MSEVPYGYCQCGCGEKTRIAAKTYTAQHQRKGQPNRFLAGHRPAKHPDYLEEDHGYNTPCWVWQGGKDGDDYGLVNRPEHRGGAHIWYYKQAKGPIPEGLELDHLCRVPSCVNPEHLEAITHEENVRRGARARTPQTHCKRGHEFTPSNTLIGTDGRRHCRACHRYRDQRRRSGRL